MPAAGPSVRISRAVRRRSPGPVLWVRGAPPRSVSAPAGPPPVWRGAVRPVLCSPADSARCRTASAVLSFRPWRDSRIPGAAFDLCPSARSGRARSAGLRPGAPRCPSAGPVFSVPRGAAAPRSAPVWGAAPSLGRRLACVLPSGLPDVSPPPGSPGRWVSSTPGRGLQLWAGPSSWAGRPWPGAVRPRGAVRISQAAPGPSVRARAPLSGWKAICSREAPGSRGVRAAPFGALPAPWRGVSPRIGSVPAVSLAGGSMPPSVPLWGPSSRNVSSVPGGGTSSSLPDVSPPPKLAAVASGPGAVSPSARTRMSWADVRPGALPEAGAPAPEIRSAPPSRGTGATSRRMLRCSAGLRNPSVCPADRSGAAPGPAVFPRTVSC